MEFIIQTDFIPDVEGAKKAGLPELVRCKDCRKNGSFDCPLFTDAVEMEMDEDWFCADGARNEGDGE